jgi:hypothetical protein
MEVKRWEELLAKPDGGMPGLSPLRIQSFWWVEWPRLQVRSVLHFSCCWLSRRRSQLSPWLQADQSGWVMHGQRRDRPVSQDAPLLLVLLAPHPCLSASLISIAQPQTTSVCHLSCLDPPFSFVCLPPTHKFRGFSLCLKPPTYHPKNLPTSATWSG